jgi:hypothetical protein
MAETFSTDLTRLLGVKHPVMLAGMNVAAGKFFVRVGYT